MSVLSCPLCSDCNIAQYYSDSRRDYFQCAICELVFVEPSQHLSPVQEKAEYDLHQNSPADKGYRRFLSRIADPVLERVRPGACGLDFGCGPGPTLSVMLREAGYNVSLYDVFYFPDKSVLQQRYDFITASEVVEHLSEPGKVLSSLWPCLKEGSLLAIMTKRVRCREAFAQWHYKNDMTHVCFFSEISFQWLAKHLGATLEVVSDDVVLLHKCS